jgi:hypothetical protein
MEYLLRVQKAIAHTNKAFAPLDEYAQGWIECGEDLSYGVSLGSDHAVRQQINNWVDITDDQWEDVWQGYYDRMAAINEFLMND